MLHTSHKITKPFGGMTAVLSCLLLISSAAVAMPSSLSFGTALRGARAYSQCFGAHTQNLAAAGAIAGSSDEAFINCFGLPDGNLSWTPNCPFTSGEAKHLQVFLVNPDGSLKDDVPPELVPVDLLSSLPSVKYCRIPLALFNNANGLNEVGTDVFTPTPSSGSYQMFFPKQDNATLETAEPARSTPQRPAKRDRDDTDTIFD